MTASAGRRLVLATANPDKVAEIAEILPGWELVPRPPEVPDVVEDADTLEGNARLKAVAICDHAGEAAVADDTGLFVDALDGRPGVFSARYSGPDATYASNVAKLLGELGDRPEAERGAEFRTVALVRFPDGGEVVAEGAVRGVITFEARAADGAFGYDPVFRPAEGDGRVFSEMTGAEKHAISHRGRAFTALANLLADRPG